MTKEMIQRAMQCEDADELIDLAKEYGIDLTREEAEAYLAEMDDFELDGTNLKNVAGGSCWNDCPGGNKNLSAS